MTRPMTRLTGEAMEKRADILVPTVTDENCRRA